MRVERTPIVAGNWKMNTSLDDAKKLVAALLEQPAGAVERVVMPPFLWIVPLAEMAAGTDLQLGAQDCAAADEGAFTGEVSARMLAPLCRYVIVGHSERRHVFHENDEVVATKLRAVLRNSLAPVLCVGELLEEREQGQAEAVVERQLRSALDGLEERDLSDLVVAYEPVWAIGTGRAATADDAQEMAGVVRRVLRETFSDPLAKATRVQYGGSVNAENASQFFALPDVDGALVGGASLKADEFLQIIAAAQQAG